MNWQDYFTGVMSGMTATVCGLIIAAVIMKGWKK